MMVRAGLGSLTSPQLRRFAAAGRAVKLASGFEDNGLRLGRLEEVESVNAFLRAAAPGKQEFVTTEWDPKKVQAACLTAKWSNPIHDEWAWRSARELLRVCSELGLGLVLEFEN